LSNLFCGCKQGWGSVHSITGKKTGRDGFHEFAKVDTYEKHFCIGNQSIIIIKKK